MRACVRLTRLTPSSLPRCAGPDGRPARTDWQENPFPVESLNGELNEKMAEVFSEEQRRLWQQRIGVWGRLFGAGERGPGRRD